MNYKKFSDRGVNAIPAILGYLVVSGFDTVQWLGALYYPMYWGTLAVSIAIIAYAIAGLFEKKPSEEHAS